LGNFTLRRKERFEKRKWYEQKKTALGKGAAPLAGGDGAEKENKAGTLRGGKKEFPRRGGLSSIPVEGFFPSLCCEIERLWENNLAGVEFHKSWGSWENFSILREKDWEGAIRSLAEGVSEPGGKFFLF